MRQQAGAAVVFVLVLALLVEQTFALAADAAQIVALVLVFGGEATCSDFTYATIRDATLDLYITRCNQQKSPKAPKKHRKK
ncbi:hypothetical protein [Vandammella animalimorsus]|uniref:hypothetical protein n=1 Tax=Vandammella animalimorsus TaxID=2029117 RepID=UPI0011C424A6|nr:hypothetical protein [Vandammella animalimorsus]